MGRPTIGTGADELCNFRGAGSYAIVPARGTGSAADRRDADNHHAQEQALARIAAITHGFRLPRDAGRSWTRLYAGTRKLVDELDEHVRLEKEVLRGTRRG